jgi:hypothetical protein
MSAGERANQILLIRISASVGPSSVRVDTEQGRKPLSAFLPNWSAERWVVRPGREASELPDHSGSALLL